MARWVLRRFLLMIPTFVGITLVTFVVVCAGGNSYLDGAQDPESVPRLLSAGERARLRQDFGYDKPAFFNRDVEDRRRYVQSAAEEVVRAIRDTAPRVRRVAAAWALELRFLADEDAASSWAEVVVSESLRNLGSPDAPVVLVFPGAPSELSERLRSLLGREEVLLRRSGESATRLCRLGGMTLYHLGPVLDALGASTTDLAAQRVLLRFAQCTDVQEFTARAAALQARLTPTALESVARAWLDAATEATGATPSPNSAATLAASTAKLREAGGLAMPFLMPRLLVAPHAVKSLGAKILRDVAAWDGNYPSLGSAGIELTSAAREEARIHDAALERWWQKHRLHFVEVGSFARWAWHSWTDTRYATWLSNIVRFDFGESMEHRRSVRELLASRLPPTLMLQVPALLLMYLLGVPLGVFSAARRGTLRERLVTFCLFLLYAAPGFWIATLGIVYLGSPDHWDLFPIYGHRTPEIAQRILSGELSPWAWTAVKDLLWHLVLPVIVLTYSGVCVLSRYGRAGMLEVLRQDYVRTARAKGLSPRKVLWKHALRTGAIPLVTLLGGLLPTLVGGSVVVERIFSIPGLGLLAWDAAHTGDLPVAMGMITLVALATMFGYLLSDLLVAWLDPRTRSWT